MKRYSLLYESSIYDYLVWEPTGKLQYIALDAEYVPNMKPHQIKWTNTVSTNAFCPNIDEDSVKEIMALDV